MWQGDDQSGWFRSYEPGPGSRAWCDFAVKRCGDQWRIWTYGDDGTDLDTREFSDSASARAAVEEDMGDQDA
jgi:hypothetical protein